MPNLLVVSTSPGAGKTAFAASLAARIGARSSSVGLGKAFGDPDDPDAAAFQSLAPGAKAIQPVSLSGGSPGQQEMRQVASAVSSAVSSGEVAVIEGLSGDHASNRSLAEELDARVVVIAGQSDDMVSAGREYGDRLVGVVVNAAPRYKGHDLQTRVLPELQAAGIPYLGAVPDDRRLVSVTMRTINEHLGGEWLEWEENSDELVENILIGGLTLDWGPHYFLSRENAVVVVRGDRPDVQMAALYAPIKGMVLTGGIEPVEYVYYEADQCEVPLTVVQQDTLDAAHALDSLLERSRFDHPDKLARFMQLAEEGLDLEALEAALARPVTQ